MPKDEEEEYSKEENQKEITFNPRKIALIIGVIVLLLVSFVVVGKTVKVPYTTKVTEVVKEPYTDTECHDIQVPYTDTECNDIQVPYTVNECNDVEVPYTDTECHTEKEPYTDDVCTDRAYSYTILNYKSLYTGLNGLNIICYGSFDVRNNENQAGTFSFGYVFHSGTNGDQPRSPVSKSIYALGTESWTFSYDCDNGEAVSGNYITSSIPTIRECHTETKYRDKQVCQDVTKYRTDQQCNDVTKYRTDQQCNDVTKYRTDQQCNDVTKYKDVEKINDVTKYHSLFESWGLK